MAARRAGCTARAAVSIGDTDSDRAEYREPDCIGGDALPENTELFQGHENLHLLLAPTWGSVTPPRTGGTSLYERELFLLIA
jgi:hypothetical protein